MTVEKTVNGSAKTGKFVKSTTTYLGYKSGDNSISKADSQQQEFLGTKIGQK